MEGRERVTKILQRRDGIIGADLLIDQAERLHGAGEFGVGKINGDEAEFFGVAELPFEIIEQGPIEETADIGAELDAAMEGGEVFPEVAFAELLVSGGGTVFGDVDG